MLKFESGESLNFSGKSAEGEFALLGDKETKPEKPTTIVKFPGGHVEISRTSDNRYWVHIGINHPDSMEGQPGQVHDARIDAIGRYVDKSVAAELAKPDFSHMAVLIGSPSHGKTS